MSDTTKPVRFALIGLGRIMREDHLPAVLASSDVQLESVCDPDPGALERLPQDRTIRTFSSVRELLAESRPEAALVAVPHNKYLPIIRELAAAGVHILKEKPFAVSLSEAVELHRIISTHKIRFMITLQRRFNPIFRCFDQLRNHIGKVFHFDCRYTLNVPNLQLGWRSSQQAAGGGCLVDMGYHTLDLLIWYFGLPTSVQAMMTTGNREDQQYDVEDTCSLSMRFDPLGEGGAPFFGNVFLSRVFPTKQETLVVVGTRGLIEVDRFRIRRVSPAGQVVEELTRSGEWPSAYLDQLNSFARWIRGTTGPLQPNYTTHFKHVALIEAAYQSARNGVAVSPKDLLTEKGINSGD
jgi:predicted dehydrogenase